MNIANSEPKVTKEGILFTVQVEYVSHSCIVTRDALQELSQLKSVDNTDAELLELFRAYEARINGVARRLVVARVQGTPLRMSRATFSAPCTA